MSDLFEDYCYTCHRAIVPNTAIIYITEEVREQLTHEGEKVPRIYMVRRAYCSTECAPHTKKQT